MDTSKKEPERIRLKLWERAAEKYDLSKDGRVTGKPPSIFAKIECPLCEDEGLVYFYGPGSRGARRWAARCTCHSPDDVRLAKEYRRASTTHRVEWVNLLWTDIKGDDGFPMLNERDLIPSRLLTFADADGRLDLGVEPKDVLFRHRRHTEKRR